MLSGYTGERLLLTLWVGTLWAVGYIAVPTAFVSMDVVTAGNYAGKLFQIVNIIGLVAASMLLLGRAVRFGMLSIHHYWRTWILLSMFVLTLIFIAYLQPEMHNIKTLGLGTDPDLAERFGLLHQISKSVYMLNSVLGLLLVLTTDKRAEALST
jgi:hypothetical protein